MHFGQLVKQLRVNAKLTQERLAHRAELGVGSLSDIERGGRSRSHQDAVAALAAGLGLTGEARDLFFAAARGAVSGEQVLAALARQRPVTGPAAVTPRQLPASVTGFTGREAQLGELGALFGMVRAGGPGGPVIGAVSGVAGAGKSALVVHWAHQVAGEFPDGQLYANLRGHGPGKPVSPAEVLGGFLRAMGVADQDIPAGADERARMYRSALAAKRMLVILDNAAGDEQVGPLLPATSSVMVLVTSRTPLDRLICSSGAWHRRLGPLPADGTVALLRTLLGTRVDAEPAAVRELAGLCGWLPLALRVAAGRAAARPYLPLAELTAEVAGLPGRPAPPELADDSDGAVAAAVAASCQYLPPDAAELYRLLGLHPGTDWDHYAAAALIAGTPDHAERLLAMLADAYLIQPAEGNHPAGMSRYRMHDLLRGCAAGLAAARDNPDDRRAALSRLLGYYLAAAQAARDTITADPVHLAAMVARPHPASEPSSGTYLPPVGRPASAWAWLDAELANLAAVAEYAAGHGWPGYATRLAAVVDHRLTGGHTELRTITRHARSAARDAADRHAEACALIELGVMSDNDGDLAMAASYQQQALALAEDCGDLATQARARNNIGLLRRVRGDYEHAAHQHQQGSYLARQAGDRRAEARALNNLGCALTWLGRYALAAENFAQALVAASQVGYRYGAATARANHGKTAYAPAPGAPGSQPVITCAEIGDRFDEVYRWTQHLVTFELPGSPSIPAA